MNSMCAVDPWFRVQLEFAKMHGDYHRRAEAFGLTYGEADEILSAEFLRAEESHLTKMGAFDRAWRIIKGRMNSQRTPPAAPQEPPR